jgi:hypothetical protein
MPRGVLGDAVILRLARCAAVDRTDSVFGTPTSPEQRHEGRDDETQGAHVQPPSHQPSNRQHVPILRLATTSDRTLNPRILGPSWWLMVDSLGDTVSVADRF